MDGLLTRAKKMVDSNVRQPVTISTDVEGRAGTRVTLKVVPTIKGNETSLFHDDGTTLLPIHPIGVVNW